MYAIYFESKYKLINMTAIPLEKSVEDRTSGGDYEYRFYVGYNGKWELVKGE